MTIRETAYFAVIFAFAPNAVAATIWTKGEVIPTGTTPIEALALSVGLPLPPAASTQTSLPVPISAPGPAPMPAVHESPHFIGQGFIPAASAARAPLSDSHREAVYAAVDELSAILKRNTGSLSSEDLAQAVAVENHLLDLSLMMEENPESVTGFVAPFSGPEAYRLGYAGQDRLSLSVEALERLKREPALLAEYVFHGGWASLQPISDKSEARRRYGGLQRRIFGEANPLGESLRQLIDAHAPSEESLTQKGGSRGDHGDWFYEHLEEAFVRHYEVSAGGKSLAHQKYAEIAANSLSRMPDAALEKLLHWGVIDESELNLISDQHVYAANSPAMKKLAAKVDGLIETYEQAGFSEHEISEILRRLVPYSVFAQIQKDTGIARGDAAEVMDGHADFDVHIYRMHSVMEAIKSEVQGRHHAWRIVMNQGLEKAAAWAKEAGVVVSQLREQGVADPWSVVLDRGLKTARRRFALASVDKMR
jgi:hypothetical protein